MTALVIITGSTGMLTALAMGFWLYGKAVRESHLDLLARWMRDDKQSFDLFMYQQALRVTKREIALQKQNNDNARESLHGSDSSGDGAGQSQSNQSSQ